MKLRRYRSRRSHHLWILLAAVILLLPFVASLKVGHGVAQNAPTFADATFRRMWERTDAPVAAGQTSRSWYWGPAPGEVKSEPFAGVQNGARMVQYFDKARMEINNPAGDRNSEWFVTTGLLVSEMVTGKQQVGEKEYKVVRPAEIAVGGDGLSADPDAPTYTSFRVVASLFGPNSNRAASRVGQTTTATINRAGQTGENAAQGLYPGAQIAAYSDALGHNIPQAMWDFVNLKGVVQADGVLQDSQTVANWIFVMGYPITEPYWARVKIEGVYYDVLFQLFERRTLAYIPSFPKGWQVQMGNVGSHYYRWLYGGPLPSPVAKVNNGVQVPPLPASVDAEVSPQVASLGTVLSVTVSGFQPQEDIVSWFTGPVGSAFDAQISGRADAGGSVKNLSVPTARLTAGVWAITFHGKASNHESIGYFYLIPPGEATPTAVPGATSTRPAQSPTPVPGGGSPTAVIPTVPALQGTVTPTPTFPTVPTEPAGGLILSVRPGFGPPDGEFTFAVNGMTPGEGIQVKFTDPDDNVVYPAGSNDGRYQADGNGRLIFALVPTQAFPAAPTGVWLFEARGLQSGLEGVTGFTLR